MHMSRRSCSSAGSLHRRTTGQQEGPHQQGRRQDTRAGIDQHQGIDQKRQQTAQQGDEKTASLAHTEHMREPGDAGDNQHQTNARRDGQRCSEGKDHCRDTNRQHEQSECQEPGEQDFAVRHPPVPADMPPRVRGTPAGCLRADCKFAMRHANRPASMWLHHRQSGPGTKPGKAGNGEKYA